MTSRLYSFIGGNTGQWRVISARVMAGDPVAQPARLNVVPDLVAETDSASDWVLRGITSNERYVERSEKDQLLAKQQGLGRPEATCAALIPIRKSAAWWTLTQDERRAIFEEQSHHTRIGLQYLPAVARRLHHCRDLSDSEPFDFLTWFEFAPEHKYSFTNMLTELRASPEWTYIEREVDIRLVRD
ncbi:MAG TPA: chlorite dismutase family protein [Polaromonas sp.]|uniref:chlorite dismutase family protein n=1 Tax=Polaromonas sp. TaxID=1869339 RepID=UPI002D27A6C5|nr:chlorite dismutase family protein [Polaromonas sp.]HYW55450.1 chlorite dismutase family protein [Polaromonas sp.]